MVEHSRSFDETTTTPVIGNAGQSGTTSRNTTAPTAPTTTTASRSRSKSNDDVIYLNNAGQAFLDPEVRALGQSILTQPPYKMHPQEDQKRIRELFATLIGIDNDDSDGDGGSKNIAIMPSTAFATTFVARNIQRLYHLDTTSGTAIPKKTKILLLQDQFCSAVYPWQEICDESQPLDNGDDDNNNDDNNKNGPKTLSLKIVPYPGGIRNSNKNGTDHATSNSQGWTEAVLEHLTDDVLATCLPPLHWSDGALLDLERIGKVCQEKKILYFVDATQAIGAMPCTVAGCGNPLVMACSVHKWLRGPPGASLVYVSPELNATWQPLDQHGRSRDMAEGKSWEAFPNKIGPQGYPKKYFQDARKFDSGGKPNPLLLPMLRLGMEQVVERVDLTTIQARFQQLMTPLLEWALSPMPNTSSSDVNQQPWFTMTPGPHCYHLVGIRPTFLSVSQMLELNSQLEKEHNAYIAVRCGAFRIAPYLDTTPDEMVRFVDIFRKLCQSYHTAA